MTLLHPFSPQVHWLQCLAWRSLPELATMAALLAGANPGIIDEAAHVMPAGLAIAGLAHLYFFGLLRQLAPEIRTTVFVGVRMLMLLARIGVSPPCPYPLSDRVFVY